MSLFDRKPSEAKTIKLGGTTGKTSKRAAEILLSLDQGYIVPTTAQRKKLFIAFAERGLTLHGKAFDIIRGPEDLNLNDPVSIRNEFSKLIICEIKSTTKPDVKPGFDGFFFSVSPAEMLMAQSLGGRYRFVFVNTLTNEIMELSLHDIYAKAKGIYPSWSIQF